MAGAVTIAAVILMAIASSATAQVPGVPPVPIASTPTSAPAFVGGPAKPKPIARGFRVPQDPFMAPNGVSNLHVDAYQTDAYGLPGPTGRNLGITSTLFTRLCGSLTFDSQGRILTICIGFSGPVLVMLDPTTLQTLATYTLPGPETVGGDPFTHISGGGYFYLDDHDRVVVPTNTRHVYVIAESGPSGFSLVSDYDLTGVVPHAVGLLSDLPDWKGHIWFAAENGTVGWIDPPKRLDPRAAAWRADRQLARRRREGRRLHRHNPCALPAAGDSGQNEGDLASQVSEQRRP